LGLTDCAFSSRWHGARDADDRAGSVRGAFDRMVDSAVGVLVLTGVFTALWVFAAWLFGKGADHFVLRNAT
jgi:hypothetical protein